MAYFRKLSNSELPATFMLVDDNGTEVVAVYAGEEPIFTATDNDIREGKVAATDEGITTGTKVIPSYHTTESVVVIKNGDKVAITNLQELDLYRYTKLQAIICPFNTSIIDSVAAEKVAIDDNVYSVRSIIPTAEITINDTDKTIDFGITNDTGGLLVLRYFTYREIE